MIVRVDRGFRCRYANAAARRAMGLTSARIGGRTHRELGFPEESAAKYEELISSVVRTGKASVSELDVTMPNGVACGCEVRGFPERDGDGSITSVLIVHHDIGRVKLAAIGHLAARIAHDLTNAFTSILGFTELLELHSGLDGEARQWVGEIAEVASGGVALAQDLQSLCRVPAPAEPPADLNDVVGRAAATLTPAVGPRVSLSARPSPRACRAKVSPWLVEQGLVSFVLNVRDAMPEGGAIVLEIGVVVVDEDLRGRHPQARKGAFTVLAVTAAGRGTDDGALAVLFERTARALDAGGGSRPGLGLLRSIALAVGGFLTVDFLSGAVARASIYLPQADDPTEA